MSERKQRDREDELSRLFRTTQHKMNEMPSREAWRRLEQRLESRRLRKRTVIYRHTTMAAAVIAALAMITTLIIFDRRMESSDKSMAENTAIRSESVEEFALTENTDKIEEIVAEKKEQDKENIPVEPKPKLTAKDKKDKKEDKPTIVILPQEKVELADATIVEEDAVEMDMDEVADIEIRSEPMPEPEPVVITPPPSPLPTAANKLEQEETVTSGEEALKRAEKKDVLRKPSKNYSNVQKESYADDNQTFLNTKFDWLLGNWKEVSKKRVSYEEWKMDENTLVGRGYVVEKGDTIFSEQMRILDVKGTVFFETVVSTSESPVLFRLVKMDSESVVFENDSLEFPKQVVIERKGKNKFQTTFQNTIPVNIEQNQMEQLNNRNIFSGERAVRNMSRARNND